MRPDASLQIRYGLGVCLCAVLVVAVLAFVPDPLFRHRVFLTQLDDVAGIQPGTEIFFRGASVGEVKSIDLDPASRNFTVMLSISKQLRPTSCSHVAVSTANPLIPPRMSLVVLDGPANQTPQACQIARAAQDCDPVALPAAADTPMLTGCRRQPDMIETAAIAVRDAASIARTANQMAQRLQGLLQTSPDGSGADMVAIARNATQTLAALNSVSRQLDRGFRPGKGDIALTLSNVRNLSGRAAQIDVTSANGVLLETRQLLAQNQASIAELLKQGAGGARDAHTTLEGASASLVEASANLDRITANLNALSERMASDPSFLIRGQNFADPPAPGATK